MLQSPLTVTVSSTNQVSIYMFKAFQILILIQRMHTPIAKKKRISKTIYVWFTTGVGAVCYIRRERERERKRNYYNNYALKKL